jgi:hypothetical protein
LEEEAGRDGGGGGGDLRVEEARQRLAGALIGCLNIALIKAATTAQRSSSSHITTHITHILLHILLAVVRVKSGDYSAALQLLLLAVDITHSTDFTTHTTGSCERQKRRLQRSAPAHITGS